MDWCNVVQVTSCCTAILHSLPACISLWLRSSRSYTHRKWSGQRWDAKLEAHSASCQSWVVKCVVLLKTFKVCSRSSCDWLLMIAWSQRSCMQVVLTTQLMLIKLQIWTHECFPTPLSDWSYWLRMEPSFVSVNNLLHLVSGVYVKGDSLGDLAHSTSLIAFWIRCNRKPCETMGPHARGTFPKTCRLTCRIKRASLFLQKVKERKRKDLWLQAIVWGEETGGTKCGCCS